MIKQRVSDLVYDMAKPIVEELGYELVEVEYSKKNDGMNLTVFIHSPNGITLDDCTAVSRALDEPLDLLNPTKDQHYVFNVSSLGIDRPIKNGKDILRNLNREVDVKLYQNLDGKKVWRGELIGGNDEVIKIRVDETEMAFEFKKVAKVEPVIKF